MNLKNTAIVGLAMVASIGTFPYARDFAQSLGLSSGAMLLFSGLFVFSALLSNIALGASSIINTVELAQKLSKLSLISFGSIAAIASMATGFMCAVGYYNSLPLGINIVISFMVTCVNAAIYFSALYNTFNYLTGRKRKVNPQATPPLKTVFLMITIMAALLASSVFYLATINGLLSIINYFSFLSHHKDTVTTVLSLIVWLPGATLFANASRETLATVYDVVSENKLSCSLKQNLIAIVAFFSGSAYAQMTLEFFNSEDNNLPGYFHLIAAHPDLVFYILMPVTFAISTLVNAYALNNLVKQYAQSDNYSKSQENKMGEERIESYS